jgi:glucose-1-phosphate thymidylyltransferase
MNIIVPMAGRGSRLRPHTLTVPKPLVPVAGKPIVERLVEDLAACAGVPIEHIVFVTGDFGAAVEQQLVDVAARLGAQGHIRKQDEPLGTAHAILCGADFLDGPVVVAFADTLFRAEFTLDPAVDGVLFVREVEDPSAFGVVVTDAEGAIVDYVEKPATPVSRLAMIGIYAFKDGARLRHELQRLIDEDIRHGGEYQLPDALRHMTQAGLRFATGPVAEWMDCGNKAVTVETNRRILALTGGHIDATAVFDDAVVIPPCAIGPGVRVVRSVVGPHVSLGAGTVVQDSRVEDALVQAHSRIEQAVVRGAMVGNHVEIKGRALDASLGDFSTLEA